MDRRRPTDEEATAVLTLVYSRVEQVVVQVLAERHAGPGALVFG